MEDIDPLLAISWQGGIIGKAPRPRRKKGRFWLLYDDLAGGQIWIWLTDWLNDLKISFGLCEVSDERES